MAGTVRIKMVADVKDISSHAMVKSSDASRSFDGGDVDTTLSSTTTPNNENDAVFIATLSGGALTIDLTALTHADGDTRSAAGKKLRFYQFSAPSSNTGNITVAKGASNGYAPLGSTFSDIVPPGGCSQKYYFTAATAITNGSADTWDLSGTGAETLQIKLGWGT